MSGSEKPEKYATDGGGSTSNILPLLVIYRLKIEILQFLLVKSKKLRLITIKYKVFGGFE